MEGFSDEAHVPVRPLGYRGFGEGTHNDHRYLRHNGIFHHGLQHSRSIENRHHEVQEHQIGLLFGDHLKPLPTIDRKHNLMIADSELKAATYSNLIAATIPI